MNVIEQATAIKDSFWNTYNGDLAERALAAVKMSDCIGLLIEEVQKLQKQVAELQTANWYWDDRCLETSESSIEESVACDEIGDIIELRPLHELPLLRVRVLEEGYEIVADDKTIDLEK